MSAQRRQLTIATAENAQTHTRIRATRVKFLLGHDSNWWNVWMLVSLCCVAFAAVAAVVTTAGVVVTQRREAEESARALEKYKLEAGKEIALINAVAAEASAKLAEFKHASMPREVDPSTVAKSIEGYAGTAVSIFTLSEFEPSRTGALINVALINAKWTISESGSATGSPDVLARPGIWIEVAPMAEPIRTYREGIEVNTATGKVSRSEIPPEPDISQEVRDKRLARLNAAAVALRDTLQAQGIAAEIRPFAMVSGSFPIHPRPDSIAVYVGLKPLLGMPADLSAVQPHK